MMMLPQVSVDHVSDHLFPPVGWLWPLPPLEGLPEAVGSVGEAFHRLGLPVEGLRWCRRLKTRLR